MSACSCSLKIIRFLKIFINIQRLKIICHNITVLGTFFFTHTQTHRPTQKHHSRWDVHWFVSICYASMSNGYIVRYIYACRMNYKSQCDFQLRDALCAISVNVIYNWVQTSQHYQSNVNIIRCLNSQYWSHPCTYHNVNIEKPRIWNPNAIYKCRFSVSLYGIHLWMHGESWIFYSIKVPRQVNGSLYTISLSGSSYLSLWQSATDKMLDLKTKTNKKTIILH